MPQRTKGTYASYKAGAALDHAARSTEWDRRRKQGEEDKKRMAAARAAAGATVHLQYVDCLWDPNYLCGTPKHASVVSSKGPEACTCLECLVMWDWALENDIAVFFEGIAMSKQWKERIERERIKLAEEIRYGSAHE